MNILDNEFDTVSWSAIQVHRDNDVLIFYESNMIDMIMPSDRIVVTSGKVNDDV